MTDTVQVKGVEQGGQQGAEQALLAPLLDALFPAGHAVQEHPGATGRMLVGTAQTDLGTVAVLGTADAAAVNHEIALGLAGQVLEVVAQHPGRPIVFLVDTQGQVLSRAEELLCLNGSFAHLARCVDFARRQGHVSLSVIYGEAVSGGFLSFGLMADRAYALAAAQVRVMDLRAMARVTKLAHERLLALAADSPIFAPGAENYLRMGALSGVWAAPDAAVFEAALAELQAAQQEAQQEAQQAVRQAMQTGRGGEGAGAPETLPPALPDVRMTEGEKRGGRRLAGPVMRAVLAAPEGGSALVASGGAVTGSPSVILTG